MKIMVFAFMDIKRELPAVGSVRPQPGGGRVIPQSSARGASRWVPARCGAAGGGGEPPAHTPALPPCRGCLGLPRPGPFYFFIFLG